ncbi:MAG: META domain-containing protein [Rhizobacter sp.]|nr:META domain-containing protein [Chlorobiales bacterium]
MKPYLIFLFCLSFTACGTPQPAMQLSPPTVPSPVTTPSTATPKPEGRAENGGAAVLENTYWKLVELGGKKITTSGEAREVHFRLYPSDKTMKGFGGCNNCFGSYEADKLSGAANKIRFGEIGATRMACPNLDGEAAFLNALKSATTYAISGETMQLFSEGKVIAKFESVYF